MNRRPRINWSKLKHEALSALQGCPEFPSGVRIEGRMDYIDAGINHHNYIFDIVCPGRKSAHPKSLILRKIGLRYAYDSLKLAVQSLKQEAVTLQSMANIEIEFDVPQFICFVGESHKEPDGLIETVVYGQSLENLKRFDQKREFVIESIARIAAAVHRLPLEPFLHLQESLDNRGQILNELDTFQDDFHNTESLAATAIHWIRENLPENRPAVLLHGDLLPQNILWEYQENRLGLIDWEFARIGDPAYDLAIVTRGNNKLCGLPNGLRRLVDMYLTAGGLPITATDVMIQELLMVLKWLEESIRQEHEKKYSGNPPQEHRNKLRAILRRAKAI